MKSFAIAIAAAVWLLTLFGLYLLLPFWLGFVGNESVAPVWYCFSPFAFVTIGAFPIIVYIVLEDL